MSNPNSFPNSANLLTTTAVVVTTTGSTYKILGSPRDDVSGAEQEFAFVFEGSQTGGASSPTADLKVQTSIDGSVWHDVCSATQMTSGAPAVSEFKQGAEDVPLVCKYVRAKLTLAGGTNPTTTCSVNIISNGRFTIEAA